MFPLYMRYVVVLADLTAYLASTNRTPNVINNTNISYELLCQHNEAIRLTVLPPSSRRGHCAPPSPPSAPVAGVRL